MLTHVCMQFPAALIASVAIAIPDFSQLDVNAFAASIRIQASMHRYWPRNLLLACTGLGLIEPGLCAAVAQPSARRLRPG